MARSEARIFTSVWDDEDWLNLSVNGRHTYTLLLTQEDLTHCGLIPLREALWAARSRTPLDEIYAGLKELEAVEWVVIDQETRELLVRSLIRRDKVLRQPKLWLPLSASIRQAFSVRIRVTLLGELLRTRDEGDVNRGIARPLDDLIAQMERQLDSLSATHPGTDPAGHSVGVPATHPGSLQGQGARYSSNHNVAPSPLPLAPCPLPPPPGDGPAPSGAPLAPVADAREGEEDQDPGQDPADLIAEIRAIRPDWSTASIERALGASAVRERPWPLVCAAALAVARDPATQQPGRLEHDGPWWHRTPQPSRDPPPLWCGKCDERTRLTLEDNPRRCPDCHPLTCKEAS